MYNSALKHKWDNQNVLDYAIKTAKEEERTKIILELKKMGMPAKDIAKVVGLSINEIEQL